MKNDQFNLFIIFKLMAPSNLADDDLANEQKNALVLAAYDEL
jgi:hypothetical protein